MARKKTSKSKATADAVEKIADAEPEQIIEEDVAHSDELTPEQQDVAEEIVKADDQLAVAAHDDEPEGSSLSSKILTGLVLLFMGGALALWGGPKLAPHLPAGLAPVAQFLAPGQNTSAELDALNAEIAGVKAAQQNNTVAQDVATLKEQTGAQIQALSDQIAATDGEAIEARLAEVETQLGGLSVQMSTLTESLTGMSQQTEGLSAESNAQIAAYKAQIEGLKAEISQLSSMQGSLSQKIDDVSVTSERKVAAAEQKVSTVEVAKGFADIAIALDNGVPFADQLGVFDVAGMELPTALSTAADRGVPTLAALKSDFSGAAHSALKAAIKADGDTGVAARFGSFLKSQVTVRSLEPRDGDDADAVLSRMQGHLDADQLDVALQEATLLDNAATAAMSDWLGKAQARVAAINALQELKSNFGG